MAGRDQRFIDLLEVKVPAWAEELRKGWAALGVDDQKDEHKRWRDVLRYAAKIGDALPERDREAYARELVPSNHWAPVALKVAMVLATAAAHAGGASATERASAVVGASVLWP